MCVCVCVCARARLGFPGVPSGKGRACQYRRRKGCSSIPGLGGSPGGGHGNLLQCSRLENPHGQRVLTGYSPWGLEESDTTEEAEPTHVYICMCVDKHTKGKNHSKWQFLAVEIQVLITFFFVVSRVCHFSREM